VTFEIEFSNLGGPNTGNFFIFPDVFPVLFMEVFLGLLVNLLRPFFLRLFFTEILFKKRDFPSGK